MRDVGRAESIWRRRYESLPKTVDTSFYEMALALIATEKGNAAEGHRVLEKYRGAPYRELFHLRRSRPCCKRRNTPSNPSPDIRNETIAKLRTCASSTCPQV